MKLIKQEKQESIKFKPADKVIAEMKLRKDILFLKEKYFKSYVRTAQALGVVPKVLRDFLKGAQMHDARFVQVLARLTKVQKLCKEADKYDAAKNFENLDFDKNKDGEPNDR
jgi:hypothetical protein